MAKTISPLMSFEASGKLGKSVIYRNFKNANIVNFSAIKSARKKFTHSDSKAKAIENFKTANAIYKSSTIEEIQVFDENYTVVYEHHRNSTFRQIIKKMPTYTGLAFFGDNTLGGV
jgi:translation elongation factor P/translation initiation factor 5A